MLAKTCLGSAATVIAGQSPDSRNYNNDGNGLPFYQGKKEFGDRYIGQPTTWTTEVTKEALANDILMSVRAPVGPINLAAERVCIGRGLAAIRCSERLDRDFLFYQLLSKQSEIAGKEGAVFASIAKADIEAIQIWVPDPTEQHRIVAILDKAFDAIATAKANTERNLENVQELLSSHQAAAMSTTTYDCLLEKKRRGAGNNSGAGGVMAGWQTRPVGEAFRVVNGGTPKTGVAAYWNGEHQWITPAEMGKLASPYLSLSRRTLTDEGLRVGAELLPANSLILSTRAPIGHLVINEVPMAFNQGCKGLVPSHEIDTKFAYYFFRANVLLLESLELISKTISHQNDCAPK